MNLIRGRNLVARPLLVATVLVTTLGGAASATLRPHATNIKSGGSITFGLTSSPVVLDWTQTGFSQPGAAQQMEYEALFEPSIKHNGPYIPDLATGYSFNKAGTQFTMTVRPNMKFEDGTPITANWVAWNWSSSRDNAPTSGQAQYFNPVTSVTIKGKYTVIVNFSAPDTAWIAEVATQPLGLVASPAALNSLGQAQFDLTPIGGGPFYVSSNTPQQQFVLNKNPHYWNKANVHLSQMIFKFTSTDSNVNLDNLKSNSIADLTFAGASASPSTIASALSDASFGVQATPNVTPYIIPINTFSAPFNNPLAREALDYCMDRAGIAQSVTAGYAVPAYIYAGTSENWFPSVGGKPSTAASEKLLPYQYNVAKGTAIVNQLGGLKFTWSVLNLSAQQLTIATAVLQSWKQCGINATINPVAPNLYNAAIIGGNYQAGFNPSGSAQDPRIATTYISQTGTFEVGGHGFKDDNIQNLLQESYATNDQTKLATLWHTIWHDMDVDAVDIPVISGPSYVVYNKCIHGIEENYGVLGNFIHASVSCSVG